MLSNIGIPGLILILVLALIIFGPKKLPEIGRAFGETLKEFKKSTRDLTKDDDDDKRKQPTGLEPALQTISLGAGFSFSWLLNHVNGYIKQGKEKIVD